MLHFENFVFYIKIVSKHCLYLNLLIIMGLAYLAIQLPQFGQENLDVLLAGYGITKYFWLSGCLVLAHIETFPCF